jgi:S-layer protein
MNRMALQGFDEAYYLSAKLAALAVEYPEWATKTTDDLKAFMANVGFTPESHYSQIGYTEGLAPNAYFNHNEYTLAKAQQLFDANLYGSISEAQAAFEAAWTGDAYLHYLQYGAAEGINPSNDFDASSYLADKLADLQADSATAADWADKTEADVLAAFTAAGLTPLTHYIAFGEDEGLTVTEVPADEQVDPGELTPTEGEVFTLTTGVDTITGTAANDTINGSDTTVTGLDVVNGGEGTDTLNISDVAGAAADLTLLSVSNVENLVLTSTTSLDSAAANVSSWTGLTSAKFDLRNVAADQAVTVADTTAVEVTAKVTTAAALDINGGTTVVATVNNTVDNSAKTITVDGGAATSAVTVAQSAATATHAAAVTITDKNAASDTTADTITTVTLSGLKGGVAAINSDALATLNLSSSNQNVTIDNDTADHALALNLNGVTGGIISDVKAKTVTVTNTGAASSGITVTADLATAISFAGDKAVTTNLGATQAANLAITVTNTAGVTIGTALDTDVSFTGAAGADSVIVGATTKAIAMGAGNDTVAMSVAVGTGGSVDAGEGTDTLAMLSASAAAVSANATFESGVSNFEKVSLAATLAAAADTVNMANLDDINYLVSAGVIATGALTVTNMAANSTFELTGLVAGASSLALTDATGSADVINLKFSAADGFTSTAALTVAGVETIFI